MNDEITVKVHSYGPKRPLALVYIDPVSRKKKAKSAETYDLRTAERLAGELEKQLRAGRSPWRNSSGCWPRCARCEAMTPETGNAI
jgi:hypothetical protein